jgi:hypothetical protein
VASRKRPLDRLLRALGRDTQLSDTPDIDTQAIVLTANVDNLAFAHPAAAFGRLLVAFIPSAGAATFSAAEFTPDEGVWIRELFVVGGNSRMNMQYGGGMAGAFTVADNLALTPVICGRPEDCDFDGFVQGNMANITGVPATGFPRVFRDAQIGQAPINLSTGVFTAAVNNWRDLFVPAGATFGIYGITVNTALTIYMQLDLPAENFFA